MKPNGLYINQMNKMSYPTMIEVEAADRETICMWHRFLFSPIDSIELKIINRINERFKELGGFTPEISKQIGWNNNEK